MIDAKPDAFAPHVRRNVLCMGSDITLFVCGISFVSWSTILPIFVRHLTASNLLLGALPAVRNLGLNVPPILVSHYLERIRHFRRFVLVCTIFERIPYLLLALATLWFGASHPIALLLVFFATQLVVCVAGGVTTPAWLSLVSLAIPIRLRGRFFGFSAGLGGLLGVGAAALTVEILKRNPFPRNFAICFLATFFFLVLSYIALASIHEPQNEAAAPTAAASSVWRYLRSLPAFLGRERNFALFLLASVFSNILTAIAPFVTASASRTLHVSDVVVGTYSVVLLAVSTLGTIGWGWLGDKAGYRPVLICGNVAGVAAMVIAVAGLAGNDSAAFYGVFALLGIYNSATQLASFTIVTEFGTPEERPTFIALSSLVLAPVAIGMPILGGIVADAFGFDAIFLVTGAGLAVSAFMYGFVVRDPRHVMGAAKAA